MFEKLEDIRRKYDEVRARLADPDSSRTTAPCATPRRR